MPIQVQTGRLRRHVNTLEKIGRDSRALDFMGNHHFVDMSTLVASDSKFDIATYLPTYVTRLPNGNTQ